MRGPYSDYAAPPIYIYPDQSGPRPGVRFSRQEIFQLIVAILALSAALTLAQSMSIRTLSLTSRVLAEVIGLMFLGALVAVATGVGLHEVAHKIVAQRYGHWAEFRYNLRGLALAFVFAFFGFLIGAPGATWVSGSVTPPENGKISAAGPTTNLAIGTFFLIAGAFAVRTVSTSDLVGFFVVVILSQAFTINVILAGFNMIPILPFDGSKVWVWNKVVYFGIIVVAIALYLTGIQLRVGVF